MASFSGSADRLFHRLQGDVYPYVADRFKFVFDQLSRNHTESARTPQEKFQAERYVKRILEPECYHYIENAVLAIARMELDRRISTGALQTAPVRISTAFGVSKAALPPKNFSLAYTETNGNYRLRERSDINAAIEIAKDPPDEDSRLFAWALILHYLAQEMNSELSSVTAKQIKFASLETPEDFLQRTGEKVYKKIQTFDPTQSSFKTWVKTIIRNTASDQNKYSARRPVLTFGADEQASQSQSSDYLNVPSISTRSTTPFDAAAIRDAFEEEPEAKLQREEYRSRLENFLKTYPNKNHVSIFKAVYFEGITREEYSEIYNINYNTARANLSRIVTSLKGSFPDIEKRLEDMRNTAIQLRNARRIKGEAKEIPFSRSGRKSNPEEPMPKVLIDVIRSLSKTVLRNA
jgi:RNA polymerase sigma factor (sigma-70 family)